MRSTAECAIPLTIAFATNEPGAVRMLAPSERRTCASLGSRERRSDWLAGRFAAKLAIARCSGISDCNRIVLRSRVDMPPAVHLLGTRGARQPLPIALSIAHCTGRAVAAVANSSIGLGVDLERTGSVKIERLRYFLTPAEHRGAARYTATALWALKEAAWKALGADVRLPFRAVALRFDSRVCVNAVSVDSRTIGASASLLRPWRGFIAAVVVLEEPR